MNALLPIATLIAPDDTWALWALIIAGVALSIYLEQNFRWAAKISGPVLALLLAMLLSNLKVMPTDAPVYDVIGKYLVPLALPLLLLRANIFKIVSTRSMLVAFHLATLGTLLGTFLAAWMFKGQMESLPEMSGIMAASYIGGAINFLAVAVVYQVDKNVTGSLIVADNFIMAGCFMVMLAISESKFFRRRFSHPHSVAADTVDSQKVAAEYWRPKPIGLLDIAKVLAIAVVIAAVASKIAEAFAAPQAHVSSDVGWRLFVAVIGSLATSIYVWITLLSVTVATLFDRWLERTAGAQELGGYLLYIFLFAIGLPADLLLVLSRVPLMFAFCLVIAVANIVVTLVLGKLLRLNLEELLLAMNASLGGPPTAAAMAISKGWPKLVLPGLLAGIYGYMIGTALGIVVVEVLRRV